MSEYTEYIANYKKRYEEEDEEEEKKKVTTPKTQEAQPAVQQVEGKTASDYKSYIESYKSDIERRYAQVEEKRETGVQQVEEKREERVVELQPEKKGFLQGLYNAINTGVSKVQGLFADVEAISTPRESLGDKEIEEIRQTEEAMTRAYALNQADVITKELLVQNANTLIADLTNIKQDLEKYGKNTTSYLADVKLEAKRQGVEFDAKTALEERDKRLKDIAIQIGYFSKDKLSQKDLEKYSISLDQVEGMKSRIDDTIEHAKRNIELNKEVSGEKKIDKNVWNQIKKEVQDSDWLPSLLKGGEMEITDDYQSAMAQLQQGQPVESLTLDQRTAIIERTNRDWENYIDRGIWAELPSQLADSTSLRLDLAISQLMSGGNREMASLVDTLLVGLPKTVQRARETIEDQYMFTPITNADGSTSFQISLVSKGAENKRLGVLSAVIGQYTEDYTELVLGDVLDKLFDKSGQFLANTKLGKSLLESEMAKKVNKTFVVESLRKAKDFLAKNETTKTLSKLLGLDSVKGETLEEFMQDITNSVTSGQKYEISTDYLLNLSASTALMTFIQGGVVRVAGVLSEEQTRKFVNEVNNNKKEFGLPPQGELTEDKTIIDTQTGEDITSKVLNGDYAGRYEELLSDVEKKRQEIEEKEGEVVPTEEEVTTTKEEEIVPPTEEEIFKEQRAKELEAREKGEVYVEEGDEDITKYSMAQRKGVDEVVGELQNVIDIGPKKRVVSRGVEGELIFGTEGIEIPDYIPEDLRSRKVLQEAVDAIMEGKIPPEGSPAWEAYQVVLQEGKARAEEPEIEEIEEKVRTETVYHGEEGNNWISMSKDFAPEYLDSSANIPEIDDESADRLASEFLGKNIEYSVATTDLWSKPTEEFRKFLLSKGYDGFIYEDDVFVANKDIIHEAEVKNITKEDVEEMNRRAKIEQEEDYTEEEIAQYKRENPKQYALDQYIKKVNEKVKDAGGYDKYVAYLEREIEAQQKVVDDYKFIFKTALESDMGELSKEEEQEKEKLAMMKKEMEVLKESPLAFYNEEDVITDEDLPFRKAELQTLDSSKLRKTDLQEFKRLNRELFGDEKVEILEQILTPDRQKALGKYMNAWIQLRAGQADLKAQSTYFHEAVHKALDMFLTPQERQMMIEETKKVVGVSRLRDMYGNLSEEERVRIKSLSSYAEGKYEEALSEIRRKNWVGIADALSKDKKLTQGSIDYLERLSSGLGLDASKLVGFVVEEKNTNTGVSKYYLVEGIENGVHASNLIGSEELGIGGEKLDSGLEYSILTLDKQLIDQKLRNPYTEVGVFDARSLPYSSSSFQAERQREYRIKYGILEGGNGEYKGSGVNDIDAMAKEWLAENIIDHINNTNPTTFWGKLKAMIDRFIDRWFRTMDNIDTITEFYDALLSGRLLARQKKIEKQRFNRFNKYLNLENAPVSTQAVYRRELAKEIDKLTTKILKMIGDKKNTVSKQFIIDLTKQQQVKKVEADIIKDVLKDFPDKIEVATFKEKVLNRLLPLERVPLASSFYQRVALPDKYRGENYIYSENIYTSPYMVSAGKEHYGGRLGDMVKNREELLAARRDQLVSDYYFGHTRVEDINGGKERRLIEVQSDLYQRGMIEGETIEARIEQLKGRFNIIEEGSGERIKSAEETIKATKEEIEKVRKTGQTDTAYFKSLEKIVKDQQEWIKKIKSNTEKNKTALRRRIKEIQESGRERLLQYNDPTAHLRMVREEIRQASIDGVESLLVPTGETSVYIERLARRKDWYKKIVTNVEDIRSGKGLLKEGDLKVGLEIYDDNNTPYIITMVLENGRFATIEKYWWDLYNTADVRKEENGYTWEIYSKFTNQTIERDFDSEQEAREKVTYYADKTGVSNAILLGSEHFDLKIPIDKKHPVYKFYEETLGKYLKNNYKAVLYTDERNVSWWKVDIKPEYAGAVEAFRVDELVDYEKIARQYKAEDTFVADMLTKDPEYAMTHRPTYFIDEVGDFTQVMPSASNLLAGDVVPRDVYEHPEWSISTNHARKENQESWEAILSVRNKPEADLKVYRASSKNELNIGDWITLSKSYAKSHAEGNGLKVHEFTIKAKEAVFAGDDVNEFGYFPKDKLKEIWRKAQEQKAEYRIEEDEKYLSIKLPELVDLADQLDADIQVKEKLGKAKGSIKLGDFTPIAVNGKDKRIRILRNLFEPQGKEVVDATTGKVEQLPETDEERMNRIEQVEKVFAHEIGHLFDWFGGEKNKTLSRGNLLGRIGNLVNYTRKEFRGYENKDIRKELKTLTQYWNPFDESINDKYTKYRYSGKELYAEAISVLLNDPATVKRIAPEFYNGFTEFLARKKEVSNALLSIIDMIKDGTEVSHRLDNMDKAFKKANGIRMSIDERKEARKEQEKWQKEIIGAIKSAVVTRYEPYLKEVKKAYRAGNIELSRYEATERLLQNLDFVGNDTGRYIKDIQKKFIEPVSEAGISMDDVGKVLVLERDLGDRIDLANPQGLVYDYAKETYDKLKEQLGASKWAILKEKLDWWRDYNYRIVEKAYKAGIYSEEFFNKVATVNKNTYTPFAVVKYIDSNYVSAGIIQGKGTLSEVENPMTTQMLKSISIIEQTAVNLAKTDVVETIKEIAPEDIVRAKAARGEGGRFVMWEDNQELRDMGMDIIELREDGKRVGYWVDGYIKDMFEGALNGRDWKTLRVITAPLRMFNRIFKPLVTTGKASFQLYSNPIKDYKRSVVNMSALARMFDDANKGVVNTTTKTFTAFTKEWFANLKRSWKYAGNEVDEVTQKMLDLYVLSENIRYEDVELGTKEFSFDPVKKRVYYKSKANWLNNIVDFVRKIPVIGNVAKVWDFYIRLGMTLEVNSKVAGFQTLRKKVGEEKAAYYTRQYIGTPNYMQKGRWTALTNELVVFSNVGIQALNADSRLATDPHTASGYWVSTFLTKVLPKLLMLAGASLLKVRIPDPDDPEKEIEVNPYDYISEYYKSMYTVFPIGYDEETGKWLFWKIPNDEVGGMVGNLVWKMGRYLQGDGMKIEQLAVAVIGLVPLGGENPLMGLVGDWLDYLQGRNPYDDFRGRLAINPTKWQAGGLTRFGEMVKWSFNEIGLTNFQTYDREFSTTKEAILEAPLLERMFEFSNYGLQEREIWEEMKAKQEKVKERDALLQDYFAQPSDKMLLKKIDEYVEVVKGSEPEKGWSGEDKAEATRLKNDFKMQVLAQSGDRKYTRIAQNGLTNEEKEKIINEYRGSLSESEFNDYIAQLVRYEVVKGEMFAEYAEKYNLSDAVVYKVVKNSIPVLTQESNNTLVWELRKKDLLSDKSLLKLYREDRLIKRKGYLKYKALNSKAYKRRYEKEEEVNEQEELF